MMMMMIMMMMMMMMMIAIPATTAHPHTMMAPARHHPRHRVVELEHAQLEQLHQRDRHDRLGHREDAVDRVVAQRGGALAVAQAQAGVIGEVPVSTNRHLAAGDLPRGDVAAVEMGGDPIESRGVEAGGTWLQFHEIPLCRPWWS